MITQLPQLGLDAFFGRGDRGVVLVGADGRDQKLGDRTAAEAFSGAHRGKRVLIGRVRGRLGDDRDGQLPGLARRRGRPGGGGLLGGPGF